MAAQKTRYVSDKVYVDPKGVRFRPGKPFTLPPKVKPTANMTPIGKASEPEKEKAPNQNPTGTSAQTGATPPEGNGNPAGSTNPDGAGDSLT